MNRNTGLMALGGAVLCLVAGGSLSLKDTFVVRRITTSPVVRQPAGRAHPIGAPAPARVVPAEVVLAPAEAPVAGGALALERLGRRLGGRVTEVEGALEIAGAPALPGSPEEVAGRVLEALAAELGGGWVVLREAPARGRAFVHERTIATEESELVDFQPYVDGLPIEDGRYKVELRRASSGLVPVRTCGAWHAAPVLANRVSPAIAARVEAAHGSFAVAAGMVAAPVTAIVARPTGDGYRAAFRVDAPGDQEARRTHFDAETDEVLATATISCTAVAQAQTYAKNPAATPRTVRALPRLYVNQGSTRATTDANGNHPLTGTVSLPQGMSGPFLRIFASGVPELAVSSAPATFTLVPNEATVRQDEVSAFWHVQTYSDHLRATYSGAARAASVRFAVAVGKTDLANAYFMPLPLSAAGESFPSYLVFGVINGRSTARDSDICRHEYTHAVLNGIVPLTTGQAAGINEGLSDYFPCAQQEDPRLAEYVSAPFMRALDNVPRRLVWPQDSRNGEPHAVGNVFGQALWEARTNAEAASPGARLAIDRAVFAGVLRFPPNPTLAQARAAILAGDQAVNGGANARVLSAAFASHGIAPGR